MSSEDRKPQAPAEVRFMSLKVNWLRVAITTLAAVAICVLGSVAIYYVMQTAPPLPDFGGSGSQAAATRPKAPGAPAPTATVSGSPDRTGTMAGSASAAANTDGATQPGSASQPLRSATTGEPIPGIQILPGSSTPATVVTAPPAIPPVLAGSPPNAPPAMPTDRPAIDGGRNSAQAGNHRPGQFVPNSSRAFNVPAATAPQSIPDASGSPGYQYAARPAPSAATPTGAADASANRQAGSVAATPDAKAALPAATAPAAVAQAPASQAAARPAANPDQTLRAGSLESARESACGRESFVTRMVCNERVRWRYCQDRWNAHPDCMVNN